MPQSVWCKVLHGAVCQVGLDIRCQNLHIKQLRRIGNPLPPVQVAGVRRGHTSSHLGAQAGEQLPLAHCHKSERDALPS